MERGHFAPEIPLPPYAYVPGHGWPHPVDDPRGHLDAEAAAAAAALQPEKPASHHDLAAMLLASRPWRHAVDLFNTGYAWEAHEAWESFWHALGRRTPEARFVQGLIHLAAAVVKIREGKPAGVATHARRARALLGGLQAEAAGAADTPAPQTLGLAPESLAAVLDELDQHRPACWHTARAPVVRVLTAELRLQSIADI